LNDRDRIANEVLFGTLEDLVHAGVLSGHGLVAEEPTGEVLRWGETRGLSMAGWDRRMWRRDTYATPAPRPGPDGGYDWAVLRLPKSRDELAMHLHLVGGSLRPGAPLLLYGARDEGIGPAADALAEVAGYVTTLRIKARCRVLQGLVEAPGDLRADYGDWRVTSALRLGPASPPVEGWVSYPGLFGAVALASGEPDPGTALLLSALPRPPAGARILDFGSGTGVIAAGIRADHPDVDLTLMDHDALAVEAGRENVPRAEHVLGASLMDAPDGFDWIVSNPPYHQGKGESMAVVDDLVDGATQVLKRKGRLFMVVQRRLKVGERVAGVLRGVEVLAEDGTYQVLGARA
jgi:16S rRNA (guanine1207-N2)-methyltransferase